MKLNEIKDNEGANKVRVRVGRGVGSGLGKTCGAGQKGQRARSGVAIGGFEGGQMPLYRRLPKRGFTNIFAKEYAEVNLGILQTAIESGKLDVKAPITEEILKKTGVVRRVLDGVKLLGKGELKTKVNLVLTRATKSALESVNSLGGTVDLLGKNKKK
jgi:large subunit ribosomal protein L15